MISLTQCLGVLKMCKIAFAQNSTDSIQEFY